MTGFRHITAEVPRDGDEAAEAETLGGSMPFGAGVPPAMGTHVFGGGSSGAGVTAEARGDVGFDFEGETENGSRLSSEPAGEPRV